MSNKRCNAAITTLAMVAFCERVLQRHNHFINYRISVGTTNHSDFLSLELSHSKRRSHELSAFELNLIIILL